jgi:acyl-CoA dehydrogenase
MSDMNLGMTERLKPIHDKVARMVRDEIIPLDEEFLAEVGKDGDRWSYTARQSEILEGLKAKARERGLWNFWLTDSSRGYGLSTVEYAYLAEEMGKAHLGAETFNCSAPDTGNMEVLERYGSEAHKKAWLAPLLDGKIRSAYLMTEPDVASSDATNISMRCERDGDDYVLNGEKWWSSGAGDPRCKVAIVMGKTDFEAKRHAQQSMLAVPMDAPGINIIRHLPVFGYDDAPHGHAEVVFDNVRVPATNILLGEGRGFEIAQGRLGPGRIHHCMRMIGIAERALETLCQRALSRSTFGKAIADHGVTRHWIAESRMEIDQARLLTLQAAKRMDEVGNKAARAEIAMIKVVAPNVAQKVVDRAIQVCGAAGVSQDFHLAYAYARARAIRLADGPDEVHRETIAKLELKKYATTSPNAR